MRTIWYVTGDIYFTFYMLAVIGIIGKETGGSVKSINVNIWPATNIDVASYLCCHHVAEPWLNICLQIGIDVILTLHLAQVLHQNRHLASCVIACCLARIQCNMTALSWHSAFTSYTWLEKLASYNYSWFHPTAVTASCRKRDKIEYLPIQPLFIFPKNIDFTS